MTSDVSTASEPAPRVRGTGAEPVPALTVVSHPIPSRAGERVLLSGLLAGREVALSRNGPDFTRAGEPLGLPLGDPYVSRAPIRFIPAGQGIRVAAGKDAKCTSAGEPLGEEREFSPEALASGVPLELSGRVVLWLHLSSPRGVDGPPSLGMIGESAAIQHVRSHIERVADLSVPVLVRGETGTGKELVARALHERSRRAGRFVSVNLGALPAELAASELFGSVRGAFTGADRDREGFFRAAQGGTLFLDEVGEASPEVQVMLLRVLETGELYPVGASAPVAIDVRLVAATDADLEARMEDGQFRTPLFHRLAGYEVRLPPLRERREDLGALFIHFARAELEEMGELHRLTPGDPYVQPWIPAALALRLLRHPWPGNIRQLRNAVRQLVIGGRGQPCLQADAPLGPGPDAVAPEPEADASTRRHSAEVTEAELVAALRAHEWDLARAAAHLGIARSSAYDLVERSPNLHLAGDLSPEEITRCFHECQGDLDEMMRRLEVSKRALSRRLKEMGLIQKRA